VLKATLVQVVDQKKIGSVRTDFAMAITGWRLANAYSQVVADLGCRR
jgi:hypothetical protein